MSEIAPTTVPLSSVEADAVMADSSAAEVSVQAVDEAALKNKAMNQVEFYLSNTNLPYDKFLWTVYSSSPEHWISIATLASFKRMRPFKEKGIPWVAEALEASTELELDESKNNVRRRTEPMEALGSFDRSVYAKGFGEETPTLQTELEAYFEEFGPVLSVRMRRDDHKKFKGSVFVEFSDEKYVSSFLKAQPKPSWKGEELLIMSKDAYCEMKIKEKGLTGKAANNRRKLMRDPGTGFNAFAPEGFSNTNNKRQQNAPKPKEEIYLQFMGKKIRVHENGEIKEEDIPEHVEGATIKWTFKGEDAADVGTVSFKDIKAPFKERFSRAPFIKYETGTATGYLAFDQKLSDEDLTFVRGTLPNLNGKEVTWEVAPAEEAKSVHIERVRTAGRSIAASSEKEGDAQRSAPYVDGSVIKFTLETKEGDEQGNVRFAELKAPLKERFKHAPFIQFERGTHHGYMEFDKKLDADDFKFVTDTLPEIGGRKASWTPVDGDEAQNVHAERIKSIANFAAKSASNDGGRGGRGGGRGGGGRGGGRGRGGRGGRGRGGGFQRDRGDRNGAGDDQRGEKRKRAVEPDGGPDVGSRGAGGPPAIKRTKSENTTDAS